MTLMDTVSRGHRWDLKHLPLDAVRTNSTGQLTEDGKNSIKADAKTNNTTSHQDCASFNNLLTS